MWNKIKTGELKNRRRREEPTKGEKGEKERRRERRRVAGTHSCSDSCYRVIEWRPPDCTRYALPARWNHLAQSVLFYPWEFAGPLYIHTYAIRVPDTSDRQAAAQPRMWMVGPFVPIWNEGSRVSAGVHTVTR